MKQFKQQDKQERKLRVFFSLPNPGLRAYFAHTRLGSNEDYRTPLWKGEARESVLEGWSRILKSKKLGESLPSLMDYEDEMRVKVGPMSIQKPLKDRWEDIEAYYTCPKTTRVNKRDLTVSRAMDALLHEWRSISGLRRKSVDAALANMKLNTNSGSPYFTKRSNKDAIWFAKGAASNMLRGMTCDGIAVLGWRGQEGGPKPDDVKQRVIWMMPMHVNLAEATVYQPIIQALQSRKLFPAYISNEMVDQHITNMFDTKNPDDLVICTDFTKYDQHFNTTLQYISSSVIGCLFHGADISVWLDTVFPIKYRIPIQCDSTVYFEGLHGMASGSGGTNVDESIAHRVLQYYAANANKSTLNRYSQCNGDDGILTFPGITVDKVIDAYTKFGLEMNPSKQYASTRECVYLRRWHATYYRRNGVCVGVYSTFRALGKLLGQERYYDPDKWSREMVVLRSLAILENCKWHPLFHDFIDYVLKGDKFRLGLDLPGFFSKLDKYAREAIDMKDSFLGFNRTNMSDSTDSIDGINNWAVVKYLRTKLKK